VTPDGGQRNCLKYVELYSKNKFEELVHLVGFIIRIYHDARSPHIISLTQSNPGVWKNRQNSMEVAASNTAVLSVV